MRRIALATALAAMASLGVVWIEAPPDGGWATNEPEGYTLVYSRDMDADPPMPVSPASADADGWRIIEGQGEDNIETVTEGGRTFMRVTYPEDLPLGNSPARWTGSPSGLNAECIYQRTRLRYSANWNDALDEDLGWSSKLYFIRDAATTHNSYVGGIENDTEGWDRLLLMTIQDGCGGNRRTDGERIPALDPGQELQLETLWCANTPGVSDGILRAWINGALYIDETDVCIYDTGDVAEFDHIWWDPTYGAHPDPTPEDMYLDIFNVYLSHLPAEHVASLDVSPTTHTATAVIGESDGLTDDVDVENDGDNGSSLDWTASIQAADDCTAASAAPDDDWLQLVSGSGTDLGPGTPDTFQITYTDSQDCDEGEYEATVRVASAEADDSPKDVTVTLTVLEPSGLTAAIAANRTSGVSPLAVHFHGIGSDCDGDSTPSEPKDDIESCDFTWDLGDSGDDPYEYGALAHAGLTQPSNVIHGPNAAKVYECASGTCEFTVTLTIRNAAGETAIDTETITVTANDWTRYCVSTSGNFTGCTGNNVTTSSFETAVGGSHANIGTGTKRVSFRCDESWTQGSPATPSGSGTLFDSFGSCDGTNRPVISGSGTSLTPGAYNVIVDGLDIVGTPISGGDHVLIYKSRVRDAPDIGVSWDAYASEGALGNAGPLYIVRSEIVDNGSDSGGYGYYTRSVDMVVILGSEVSRNGNGNHNLRMGGSDYFLIHASTLVPNTGAATTFKINGEIAERTPTQANPSAAHANWGAFTSNYVECYGHLKCSFASAQNSDGNSDGERLNNVHVARNVFKGGNSSFADEGLVRFDGVQGGTFASNVCLSSVQIRCLTIDANYGPSPTNLTIAGNTSVWTGGAPNDSASGYISSSGSGHRMTNNLQLVRSGWSNGSICSCTGCATSCTDSSQANEQIVSDTGPFATSRASIADVDDVALSSARNGVDDAAMLRDIVNVLRSSTFDRGAREYVP